MNRYEPAATVVGGRKMDVAAGGCFRLETTIQQIVGCGDTPLLRSPRRHAPTCEVLCVSDIMVAVCVACMCVCGTLRGSFRVVSDVPDQVPDMGTYIGGAMSQL